MHTRLCLVLISLFGYCIFGQNINRCVDIIIPVLTNHQQQFNCSSVKTFKIAAQYCNPTVAKPGLADTLQILIHGLSYTRDYWNGLGYQDGNYSWTSYASKQGYATLTIDRIGSGLSDHPDPVLVVQLANQVEILHEIIKQCKAGRIGAKRFKHIVLVGHSYGSIIINSLVDEYPDDSTSIILTGFSNTLANFTTAVSEIDFLPAKIFLPSRFGSLAPGYLVTSSRSGREAIFYSVPGQDFDTQIYAQDWIGQGTIAEGELTGLETAIQPALEYKGRVLLMTGENDLFFCGGSGIPNSGRGICTPGVDGIPAKANVLYPNAVDYQYYVPFNTGHDINLHYSALATFQKAHGWLIPDKS